jgi:site-specific DNA-methyltransferase (adenine-specific)
VALFPDSKGQQGDVRGSEPSKTGDANCYGEFGRVPFSSRNDTGSAARFFYCAKASKKDRGDDNKHPTVKPTDLMRYLCRLVTPPNGLVLDPFTGSGSTGKAAILEGFRFVGIEREAEYIELARARIDAAIGKSSDMLQFE